MRKRAWVAIVGLALLAAGCMGGPPDGPHGRGGFRGGPPPGLEEEGGDGPPRPRAQLFVSPSGQPFRAAPGQPYPSAAWFAQADTDHDGRLTRAEFRADADGWFKVLDKDGDGQLSMPEATLWEEELVPEILRGGMMMGGPGMRRGGGAVGRNQLDTRRDGAGPYSLINEPHPIRGADADFSMSVSRTEWTAAANRRFAILDPDGDGVVLAADLRPTPAQRMAGERDSAGPRAGGSQGGPPGRRPPPGGRDSHLRS